MPFSAIAGHERIIGILRRTLAAKRTAHAYLFDGPEGCGKRTTALALVEAVFCNGSDGCGSCPSCRKVAALQHPDLHLLAPDGAFIKIDQVRALQRELSLRPFEAPCKVCIIDDADRFHPAAGNALLKTLEEPPGNALLILISANPDGVLQTIRSRCQAVHFTALAEETVATTLVARGIEAETARLAASLAAGSLGKALELCSVEALGGRSEQIEQLFSLSLQEIGQLFAFSERLSADKEEVQTLLDLLTAFLRDVLIVQAGSDHVVNLDLMELTRREAARQPTSRVMASIGHVAAARHALQRNVNTRLALDTLLMRLVA